MTEGAPPVGEGYGALSFAELGLRVRAEVYRLLSPAAAAWIAEPPLALPGRPPRLPAADTTHEQPWRGEGPREWRIYTRRQADPRMPFLLRAVVPDAPPYEQVVDTAFRLFLHRLPDPTSRGQYAQAMESGALSAEVVLRAIGASQEAQMAEKGEVRLVCAPVPGEG